MEPFTVHTGRAVPLRRSNVDTDQIIPSDYLKRVSRTGFADGLFRQWREAPDFVLNRPEFSGATVLLAGSDFGTGSSREHAVWALQDWGFRAVISERFADIFRSNALKGGLLPVQLPADAVERLFDLVEASPTCELTLDLCARELRVPAIGLVLPFPLEESTRLRLLEGLDDIALTTRHDTQIAAFEAARPHWFPTTLPARG
ncbi:MAG: 3-isopropylmalate dehydratase small subunit [Mycobacteriales bacterium]